jgi:hypothetical protein
MTNQIAKNKMSLKINVEVVVVKEGDYFVAYCPALELSAYGDKQENALKSFDKEVKIFLDETHKRGTLERYLLKNGWRLQQTPNAVYEPPRPDTASLFEIFKGGKDLVTHNVYLPV